MKNAILFTALTLQVGLASETESWSEWKSKADALARLGQQNAAIEAYRKACEAAIPDLNITNRQYLGLLNASALEYAAVGKYLEAQQQWQRAATAVEKSEGAGSLDYALLMAGMASLPVYSGNLEDTSAVLRRAIASYRSTASSRDLTVLSGNLARLLILQGQFPEAESLLRDSLSAFRRQKRDEPEARASLLNSLGLICYRQARYAESADLHQEELSAIESAFGGNDFRLVSPLNNLANSLVKSGRAQEAAALYQRGAIVCDAMTENDEEPCGILFENYSELLRGLGHKKEARQMAARGREMEKSSKRRNGIGFTVSASALTGK